MLQLNLLVKFSQLVIVERWNDPSYILYSSSNAIFECLNSKSLTVFANVLISIVLVPNVFV